MNANQLFLMITIVLAAFHLNRSDEADELDEINVFVQSVLTTADRSKLGLPDRAPVRRYTPPVDGQLPADLQRYLEGLVRVSSVADKQTLVLMLWDDTLVVDEDQNPHDMLDRLYRGRRRHKIF